MIRYKLLHSTETKFDAGLVASIGKYQSQKRYLLRYANAPINVKSHAGTLGGGKGGDGVRI